MNIGMIRNGTWNKRRRWIEHHLMIGPLPGLEVGQHRPGRGKVLSFSKEPLSFAECLCGWLMEKIYEDAERFFFNILAHWMNFQVGEFWCEFIRPVELSWHFGCQVYTQHAYMRPYGVSTMLRLGRSVSFVDYQLEPRLSKTECW